MRAIPGLACSLLLLAAPGARATELSDDAARRGIEINWNRHVDYLLLGERVVVKDIPPASCTSENISVDQYEFLLDAEKAGYAKISYWKEFRDYSKGKTFSREQMVELAASGVVKKFTILPTKKAEAVKVKLSITGRTGCLSFKTGTYKIDQILRNEPQQKKSLEFRIIALTYQVTYEPMVLDIMAARIGVRDSNRKAVVLIQYNPARKNWDIAAFDAANANEDFKTHNVDDYLAKQK